MIGSLRASWHTVAAVVIGISLSTGASAAPIVVDYDAAAQGVFLVAPYVEDGVTMSVVTGHYDILAAGGGGRLANIDSAGGASKVSFSLGGSPFTLVSILFPTAGQSGLLTASDGSVVAIPATGGAQNFNLPGITSFTLAHVGAILSFDDVTLDMAVASPEPSSLLLLGAGLAALRLSRLRRRRD